uniref:Ribonuclease Y n=1 Tax=uncultured Bacteroidota bacterium TaxID=152509 RepID=H5SIG8_9BACT|nr:KH/HDIG domain protein [uncultured Bacteroidetes bacterium]
MTTLVAILAGFLIGGGAGYGAFYVLTRKHRNRLKKQEEEQQQRLSAIEQEAQERAKRLEQKAYQRLQEASRKLQQAEREAERRIREKLTQEIAEAQNRSKQILQEAQARLADAEERQKQLIALEESLNRRQDQLQSQLAALQKDFERLEAQKEKQEQRLREILLREESLAEKEKQLQARLEELAGMSREEALQKLMETLQEEAERRAHTHIQQILEEAERRALEESQRIIAITLSRVGVEQSVQHSITTFPLDSDEHKGRIIGREGRNIRTLESLTGVEIVVDDTPGTIVISCYDPIRREIASRTLQRLLADGRVHPARIEEVVKKVEQEIEHEIREAGQKTLMALDIRGVAPEVRDLVGKMKFRFSFGQNLLHHSKEVARLAAILAAELGLPPEKVRLAKRAALFHDIGKVSEENPELPHALLGMEILRRNKEHPDVLNAVGAHHDEIPMETIIAPIVQLADAISGARPGARRETVEKYIQRIQELEAIPKKFAGVSQAYAIQAGRELRILVESDKVSDADADKIAQAVAEQIQSTMQYPGQIKVTVIREKRSTAYAR